MKTPAGAGISIPGAAWIGEIARRKARGRSVIPVAFGVAVVVIVVAIVVVPTIALPYHDLTDAVPAADPAVVVPAVPVVHGDDAVAAAGPVLRGTVALDPPDHDDLRALDHDHPAGRGTAVGGVPVAD